MAVVLALHDVNDLVVFELVINLLSRAASGGHITIASVGTIVGGIQLAVRMQSDIVRISKPGSKHSDVIGIGDVSVVRNEPVEAYFSHVSLEDGSGIIVFFLDLGARQLPRNATVGVASNYHVEFTVIAELKSIDTYQIVGQKIA